MTEPSPTDAATAEAAEKKVSWAELFFDLVFVVAVTRVSALVEEDHGWGGLLRALIVFVPVYWTWVGTSIQANQRDITRPLFRIQIFAVALGGIFMALALPDAYGEAGLVFALAYWFGRIVLGMSVFAGAVRAGRLPLNPYLVSVFLTGPMLVVGALLPPGARVLLWGVAALLDLSTPSVLRRRMRGMHFDAGHLAERFGLFVLIALGESVVAAGTSTSLDRLGVAEGVAVAAAFALCCGMWWVYFHFAADAMRHSLATARVQLDITRLVLSYGHLAFIGAIIVVAVGLREVIGQPLHELSPSVGGLLYGGAAAFLAAFGYTRWAMFRLVSWTRLIAAAVVLALLPLGLHIPAVASLLVLAAVLAALNVVELRRARGGSP